MILCIIQARMGSTRLPGKVLMDINGQPMIEWVINAAEQSNCNRVVVATTANEEDRILVDRYDAIPINRRLPNGKNDVLARYYDVAKMFNPDHVLRLTGDCPMVLPDVINGVIDLHLSGGYDFTHAERAVGGYPNGLGAEIMSMEALDYAHWTAIDWYDREHVTPIFYRTKGIYNVGFYPAPRFSVDTREDLATVRDMLEGRI